MNIENIEQITKVVSNEKFKEICQTIEISDGFYIIDQINNVTTTNENNEFINRNISWTDFCKSIHKLFNILDSENQLITIKELDENNNDGKIIIGTSIGLLSLLPKDEKGKFIDYMKNVNQYQLNYCELNNIKILLLPLLLDWSIGGLLFPDDKLYSVSLKDNTLFYISKDENQDKYNVVVTCESASIYELEENYD